MGECHAGPRVLHRPVARRARRSLGLSHGEKRMKRWTVWAASAALGAPLAVGALATVARAAFQSAGPELVVASPKDGARVRERVKVIVPPSSVPKDGFVAVYVDGQFKA